MDNGGAYAIRGFNYQNAVISLICIRNYLNNSFKVIVENKDDLEVFLDNTHTYVQIKGKKLSVKSLIKPDSKTNKSVLGKNLNNGTISNRYKIATLDNFSDKDNLEYTSDNKFLNDAFEYSDKQKKDIKQALLLQGFENEELEKKLSNSYVWLSPFNTNPENAQKFLLGEMNNCGIKVDGIAGQICLNELFRTINNISAIPVSNDVSIDKKKITSEYLKSVFTSYGGYVSQLEILEAVQDKFDFFTKSAIKKQLLLIGSYHRSLKQDVIQCIGNFNIRGNIGDIFDELCGKIPQNFKDKNDIEIIYSILISIIAEEIERKL